MEGMFFIREQKDPSAEETVLHAVPLDELNDPFARQKLMGWWDQDMIGRLRVLILGAGAIGNEVLHNLVLLGFRQIFICDMDTVELSNLSRTVFFRWEDEGKPKAEVAAMRAMEACLAPDPRMDFFCGDITFELGAGMFRHFDIVLGCLDNDATRYFVDRNCSLFGKPWINAGIYELNANLQLFYHKEAGNCFHCGASPEKVASVMTRTASCGSTAIQALSQGKIPTVQVASALVAALQAQETAKFACGQPVEWGTNIYFQGSNNSFQKSRGWSAQGCMHHEWAEITDVIELPTVTNHSTMAELLAAAEQALGGKHRLTVYVGHEYGREYLLRATCRYCDEVVSLGIPRFRFRDEMAVCPACKERRSGEERDPIVDAVREYSAGTDREILSKSLGELGIPSVHVLSAYDEEGSEYHFEVSGDLPLIAPRIFAERRI